MAEWTAALQNASGDPTLQTYVRPHPKASNRPSDLTAALLAEQVNWNNCRRRAPQLLPALPQSLTTPASVAVDGRMYVPGGGHGTPTTSANTGAMSYDWFEVSTATCSLVSLDQTAS